MSDQAISSKLRRLLQKPISVPQTADADLSGDLEVQENEDGTQEARVKLEKGGSIRVNLHPVPRSGSRDTGRSDGSPPVAHP